MNDLTTQEQSAVAPQGVQATTDASRAEAEVKAAIFLAKTFPRKITESVARIQNACTRPRLAQEATYTYSRGGTDITGPSVRLAEVCAQNWGNVQFGWRELERRVGVSVVEAFCWDTETNTRATRTFEVEHIRVARGARYDLTDPRDIYEMMANQAARRKRAVILEIIPGDVVEEAVETCEATLHATADTTPEGVKKLMEAFAGVGVTRQMLERKIQRNLESIRPAQVIMLRKIFTSLKDGMSDIDTWFEVEETATETGDEKPQGTQAQVDEQLRGRGKNKEPKPAAGEEKPKGDDEDKAPTLGV